MGSTRQIFSEDRHTRPRALLATNTKIHLITKSSWSDIIRRKRKHRQYFGLIKFIQTKTIWTIAEISQTTSSEKKNRKADESLEDIGVLFFLQIFLISLHQNLSVVAPLKQTLSSFTF